MKHRWPLFVILLLTLALALAGGFTTLWRFFIFLVVLFGLMTVWSRWSLRGIGVRVKKTTGGRFIGDSLEEEFTITNNSRLPLSLVEVREDTDLSGDKNSSSFNLAAHGAHQWHTRHHFRRRGQYRVGVLDVKVTDPLGLIATRDRLGDLQFVTVYPVPLELPYFQIIPRQEPGQNLRRWFASESGPSASRVREYVSGDSLRHIHWQTTAHTGQLVVKEFDPDRSRFAFKEIWLIPDMSVATRLGEGDETTEEYNITIAASLAKKYIVNEKRVGLIASGDQPYICLAENGNRQLLDILQALALMKAGGRVPIDDLLTFQSERFAAGSVVIVIMPSDNKNIVVPLRQAINRGVTVIVVLLDSMSFGGRKPAADTARNLMSSGFHVYVVRRGQDIPAALDSRWLSPFAQYAGERSIHVPSSP
jgi:uncharacterized protein (DUF58 family)